MTCIAAVVHDNVVYMGADSAGVAGSDLTIRADQKVFINGEFLIGFTSSFRMGQLLRYAFEPPKYREDEKDLYKYMVTDFVNAVRKCLKDGGYAQVDKGEEIGGWFLVGIRGRLFKIESDYQVGESVLPYEAVGCGEAYALGVFSVTDKVDPEERIKLALGSAESFSAGVRAPFVILKI
jgi:ATP-dependent protease HslVU (ClpYQ) peptidase subunit